MKDDAPFELLGQSGIRWLFLAFRDFYSETAGHFASAGGFDAPLEANA